MNKQIIVAVGIIHNTQQEVLLAKRPPHAHQGDLWEFPGGKVDKGETVLQALKRELLEEINIEVIDAQPFMQIPFDYTDKKVLLDVWQVKDYKGEPFGREGQPLCWVPIVELQNYAMPPANLLINAQLVRIKDNNSVLNTPHSF